MITINDVHKTFNKGKANQVNAVNGITLTIAEGEFLVIVGSNGSGKTTLLNLVAGSVFPDMGSISVDENNVSKLPDYRRSQWIARVFQNPVSGNNNRAKTYNHNTYTHIDIGKILRLYKEVAA